jgi:hypothetical protein
MHSELQFHIAEWDIPPHPYTNYTSPEVMTLGGKALGKSSNSHALVCHPVVEGISHLKGRLFG